MRASTGGLDQDTKLAAMFSKINLGHQAILATIHENNIYVGQRMVYIEQRLGAVQDTANTTLLALECTMNKCEMSSVKSGQHAGLFHFDACDEYPPMVADTDDRISNLVERLQHFRQLSGFRRNDEAMCRDMAIKPFFECVAAYSDALIEVPNGEDLFLKVNIGGTSFDGKTDLILRSKGGMPILAAELKPMTGDYRLKGTDFERETFRHKSQIVLQCTAFQSICRSSKQFSCILTNLTFMYVVQIISYDADKISARIFKGLREERLFVRALLQALESNSSIPKQEKSLGHPIRVFTAESYDCNEIGPSYGGNAQTPAAGAQNATDALHGKGTSQSAADGSSVECVNKEDPKAAEDENRTQLSGVCFEEWLPCKSQQKTCVKPNFVRAWLHMSPVALQHEPLVDCSSQLNISKGQKVKFALAKP